MLPLLAITLLGLSWTSAASALPCSHTPPSQPPPSTVHSVKPSDVAMLSAIGLSHTHCELSKVVSRFQELMTLFNPSLSGPLLDQTSLYSPESLQHRTLVEQAKEVQFSLRGNQHIDVDWKLVLLFVQADQICACKEQQVLSAVEAAVQQVDLALQVLQSQLKRTIVSVAVWDGEYDTLQKRRCPCMETMSEGELRLLLATLSQVLQESLDSLMVQKQRYGDRDDFTVSLQDRPLTADPASLASGRAPSELRSTQHTDKLTVQMWANVLQPASGQHNTEDNDMTITVPCPTEERPFLRTERNSPSYHPSEPSSPLPDPVTGTEMPCKNLTSSEFPPTSVHALRPGDIKVVGAVGDSLTAGNGVGASTIVNVLRQYRGLSWSIGGDENLTTVTTLPNILRQFNPNVTGYSLGMGQQTTPQAFLNQAVPGKKSKDMPDQVRTLVARMKNDSRIDFESDWKLITMFVGGNDMCDYCYNSLHYSVENYGRHIREALDYLHKEVPRALVNLVEPLHIVPLRQMHVDPSLKCPTWLVNILCPCVVLPKEHSKALQQLDDLNRGYQRVLNELVESGRYDTHDTFTVVVQPFFREIVVPQLEDGRPDRSYFSPDCFHLSQKAQTLMARSLWNNMIEPLGFKTQKQNFSATVPLKCPSKAIPFLRTHVNSNYTYAGPAPTPPPVTNWGSDFACVDLAPSPSVPTSVHMLRPGDIKVVAALGGSSTAGTGAKSNNILELTKEYRGISWSIGGDETLETVTTLPNILRKFNPLLYGFSKGQGSRRKGFNMAVSEAKSADIPAQVQALIKALRDNKNVNFEEDWKLVTLFIGSNDLCHYCVEQNNLSSKNFSNNLELSLDMLYNELPRTLVNVVEVMQIDPMRDVKKNALGCTIMQRGNCPCVLNPEDPSPELEEIQRLNQEYQTESQYLVSGIRYDGREDFTTVLQPYLRKTFVPHIGEGEPDLSLFSVDCFHISERAHAEMAIGLWNNMLEPVGRKQSYNNFTHDRSKIHCPTQAHPYIFTKINSLPNRPALSTTPSTPTGTTPSGTTPSRPTPPPTEGHTCTSSIPVWLPVILAIISLLLGIISTALFFSFGPSRKKTKKYGVEMKTAGF